MTTKLIKLFSAVSLAALLVSCDKKERPELDPNYPTDENQVLLPGNLRFFASFNKTDGISPRWNAGDSISSNPASIFPVAFEPGVTGNGMKGADNTAVTYLNTNDFKTATSFTMAFWFKDATNSGAEFVVSLTDRRAPYSGWLNTSMFLFFENGTATEAAVKMSLMDQWLTWEGGNKMQRPFFDGNWHHFAVTYDETTSKLAYFFDGALVPGAPAGATDVKKDGAARGPLDLSGAEQLVLGGSTRHVKLSTASDSWISSYNGSLDQFRLYNVVLSEGEINALFTSKQ